MRHAYRSRKTIGLVSTLALALVATASLGIASSPATAQTSTDLDAAKCESRAADGYLPQWDAYDDTAIRQCKALVAFRNQLVDQSPNLMPGHKLLQWGTGDDLKLNNWRGLSFTDGTGQNAREVDAINVTDSEEGNGELSGPIPDLNLNHRTRGSSDQTLFSEVAIVKMEKGRLTGGFPNWVYALSGLEILDLSSNSLSGSVHGAFLSTSLEQIELQGNNFSGRLPHINLHKDSGNGNLVIFSVSGNNFSGEFPVTPNGGYANFADDREMKILSFSSNRISGTLPQWIGNITWSGDAQQSQRPDLYRWQMSLNGNRLCSRGVTLGTQKDADGSDASVLIDLSGNRCEGEIEITRYTPAPPRVVSMEVSGDSVQVTWEIPLGADNNSMYLLRGASLYPSALQGELAERNIYLSSKCSRLTSGTAVSGELLLRSGSLSQSTGGAHCQFNPDYMAVGVAAVNEVGSRTDGLSANLYIGGYAGAPGWNFTHVVRAQPIQDIAYNLGMEITNSISYWDGSNQRWRSYRVGDQSRNPTLEVGTPITHSLQSRGWMDRIGVGSSGNDAFSGDDGDGITLYGGWNMISAGGEASGEDADSAAFMFDDSFVDCQNLGGAIMILRYNPVSRSYDVILPCHPTVQRSLIAGGAWGSIEDISEFDNLMIFFRSTLSVNIKWDAAESKYVPTN